MYRKGKERICFVLLLCVSLSCLIEIAESSKKSKIAKEVVKGVVERKLHKSHSRRFFPTWAIVLLVLGGLSVSLCGIAAIVYCIWRSGKMQCWPTPV